MSLISPRGTQKRFWRFRGLTASLVTVGKGPGDLDQQPTMHNGSGTTTRRTRNDHSGPDATARDLNRALPVCAAPACAPDSLRAEWTTP
jgi:hypothetical protein